MQWLCSSSGMLPITFLIAGTKVRDPVDGQQPARVLEPDGIDLAALHQVLRRFRRKARRCEPATGNRRVHRTS